MSAAGSLCDGVSRDGVSCGGVPRDGVLQLLTSTRPTAPASAMDASSPAFALVHNEGSSSPAMALADQPWTHVAADDAPPPAQSPEEKMDLEAADGDEKKDDHVPPPPPVRATIEQFWYINLDIPALGPKMMTRHTELGRCTGLTYDAGPSTGS